MSGIEEQRLREKEEEERTKQNEPEETPTSSIQVVGDSQAMTSQPKPQFAAPLTGQFTRDHEYCEPKYFSYLTIIAVILTGRKR